MASRRLLQEQDKESVRLLQERWRGKVHWLQWQILALRKQKR